MIKDTRISIRLSQQMEQSLRKKAAAEKEYPAEIVRRAIAFYISWDVMNLEGGTPHKGMVSQKWDVVFDGKRTRWARPTRP